MKGTYAYINTSVYRLCINPFISFHFIPGHYSPPLKSGPRRKISYSTFTERFPRGESIFYRSQNRGNVLIHLFSPKQHCIAQHRTKGTVWTLHNLTFWLLICEFCARCSLAYCLNRAFYADKIFWAKTHLCLCDIMPSIRSTRNRKAPPDGFDDIEDTLLEFGNKMKDVENASHEGKKKHETLWPIFQISHQR